MPARPTTIANVEAAALLMEYLSNIIILPIDFFISYMLLIGKLPDFTRVLAAVISRDISPSDTSS